MNKKTRFFLQWVWVLPLLIWFIFTISMANDNVTDKGQVILTIPHTPTTSIIFGDNVGKISWKEGTMIFEGDADESAKMFFEGFLKPLIDEYIVSEMEKEELIELILEEPEHIMYQFYTDFDEFQPVWFLKVVNTDMSKCFIDGRLRINLNGEIYWIQLIPDKRI